MSRVLAIRDLALPYDPARPHGPGLAGIDLELQAGQVLGLVGESGSGKTTLARAVAGLRSIHAGEMELMGQPVDRRGRRPRALRAQVQMVFQNPVASLDPRMTVLQSLEEPMRVHQPGAGARTRRDRARQVLERVGLPADSLSRYPHQFSGGQCQRIAIARALVVQPALLVCDEVVSALDVSVQAQILNLLMQLRQELGLAVIFVSHDLAVVRHISDRVAVMYRGRLVEQGPAVALCQAPAHPYTRDLLAATPGGGAPADPGSPGPEQAHGCAYLPRCSQGGQACATAPAGQVSGQRQVACHYPLNTP